jgi:phenylacetate-CoA ligase
MLWGHSRSLGSGLGGAYRRILVPLVDWMRNRRRFSAYDLAPATLREYYDSMLRYCPTSLYSYASAAHLLALANMDRAPIAQPLRAAFLASEPILPLFRKSIAQVFGCRSVGEYGSIECGLLAHESPEHQQYQVFEQSVLLETVPGEGGYNILVSQLRPGGFPLFRYEIGDMTSAAISRGPEGIEVLQDVQGRTRDVLRSPDGRVCYAGILTYIVEELPSVAMFSAIQRRDYSLDLFLQTPRLEGQHVQWITEQIRPLLGDIAVRVHAVARIERTTAGKLKWITSELPDAIGAHDRLGQGRTSPAPAGDALAELPSSRAAAPRVRTNVKTACYLFKYSLIRPKAKSYFKEVLANQYLPPDQLEELNWSRIKELLAYAYRNVPYYRGKFDSVGLDVRGLKGPEDYCHVPVLTRQDLKDHFEELVSREARPGDLRPVKVYHEKRVIREAQRWRLLDWWGLQAGDDMATVYRNVGGSWRARLVTRMIWWPTRRILLDAAAMDRPGMERFVQEFQRVRPPLLHGYVGAVDYLASFILDNKLSVPPPKAVWLTSAPITAVQERRIEQAFGAPVYDHYGSCEVYWLGAQCPVKRGLHMFHDVRRVEFLDDDNKPCPPMTLGRIAVTDMKNRLFPLIRYLNGDMGRRLEGLCPCGVTLPLMDKVRGRVTDLVRLPSGRTVSGDYLTTLFDDDPDVIRQFQVHQRADYSIQILVVPNAGCDHLDGVLARVRGALEAKLQREVAVEIVKTGQIAQKGGKLRFVRSDVGACRCES